MDQRSTAAVIVIGNEVLSGRTRDANIHHLAGELDRLGIRLLEARVVPDDTAAIVAAIDEVRRRVDYLFTTGGIGPTHDDITAAAVAEAFAVPLVRDPRAVALLESHYPPGELNAARLSMADIPQGAALIDNPVSRAPGFAIGNVFVLAGVPRIAAAMFDGIKGRLKGAPPVAVHTIEADLPEGRLAGPLGETATGFPEVDIGSYPHIRDGRLGVAVVLRGDDGTQVDAAARAVKSLIVRLGGQPKKS